MKKWDKHTYAFVPPGKSADDFKASDHALPLFFDVGDRNEGAVFDHHHAGAGHGDSAVGIVCSSEGQARLHGLYTNMRTSKQVPVFVTHREPDLDAVGSVYGALSCLEAMPPMHAALVDYITHRDKGYATDKSLKHSPAVLFGLVVRGCEGDEQRMQAGLDLVDALNAAVHARLLVPGETDLTTVSLLSSRFPRAVSALGRLPGQLEALEKSARAFIVMLPSGQGRMEEVKGMRVCFTAEAPSVPGFKDYLRSLRAADGSPRFELLMVYFNEGAVPRGVLSVEPGSAYNLKGLGRLLDEAEERKSRLRESFPNEWTRQERAFAVRRGQAAQLSPTLIRDTQHPRPGYRNADPWYDGRGHGWTIVDSPHSGTLLTESEIYDVLMTYVYDSKNYEELMQ